MHILSIRLSGYQFTLKDYEAYCWQCCAILAQSQARAALLRGGIVWHLALKFISFDDVLREPSIATMVHRYRLVVNHGKDGIFGDDSLTEHEFNLICGAYMCYTGKFHSLQPRTILT